MRDDNSTNKRDINQALAYYHENFDLVKSLRDNEPSLYGELDSLIQSTLAVLALWAGIAIILNSKFVGGLLGILFTLLQISFVKNVWTPKVDSEDQVTNTLLALLQLVASVMMMTGIKPDVVPPIRFKNE